MRNKFFVFISILTLAFFLNACAGEVPTASNNASNTKPANTNAVANNANNAVATVKTPEPATSNNAPTLAPVVAAYYEALKKNDDAALRKVLSAETLKTLEADMKAEKKTSLTAFITELEPAPAQPFEIRNEKIEGNRAIAEIKGGSYAVWTPFVFVNEGGAWKMTNESPDFNAVKDAANQAKTGK